MAKAYMAKGMCAEAMQVIRRSGYWGEGFQGYALARCGQKEEARKLLGRLEQQAARGERYRVAVARISLALGDKERALDWLERARRTGNWLDGLGEPVWDPLREEPRFKALRKEIGLAQ